MTDISRNLQQKLESVGINNYSQLQDIGYLTAFTRIKAKFPSSNFNILYQLFCTLTSTQFSELNLAIKRQLQQQFKQLPPYYPDLDADTINFYLEEAYTQAVLANNNGEIPIGAVIVHKEQIIATGYNQTRSHNDILKHAEIVAISQAQSVLNNFRLPNCDLYVTIEPCVMCSGAIINSRIRRLIFGATEPKTGACISQYQLFNNPKVNHHCQVIGPVNQDKYSRILTGFFQL